MNLSAFGRGYGDEVQKYPESTMHRGDPTSKDQWVRGLLGLVFISCLTGIYQAGQLKQEVVYLHNGLDKLTKQVELLIRNDLVDLRGRLSAMENSGTREMINELREDVADIRRERHAQ